jgi:hypothetical protein
LTTQFPDGDTGLISFTRWQQQSFDPGYSEYLVEKCSRLCAECCIVIENVLSTMTGHSEAHISPIIQTMNHYNIQFNYHETKCDETFDLVVDLFVT